MHKRGQDRVGFSTTHDGTVIAIAAWRVTADQRHGAFPASRATWLARLLERDGQRATLSALYGLATGTDPQSAHRLMPSAILDKICAALDAGRLLFLPDATSGHTASNGSTLSAGSDEQELVASVLGGRPALTFQGISYRLVAIDSGTTLAGHLDYAPLPKSDAVALVKRMSEKLASNPQDRELWTEVSEAVARADDQPRILLLRPRPGAAPPPREVAAAPPPSKAPIAKQSWIELQIEFEDGAPFPGNVLVEVPGGVRSEGPPDDKGNIRLDRINPGSSKVSFPDLDASAFDTA
jgi:hypothetical protein